VVQAQIASGTRYEVIV